MATKMRAGKGYELTVVGMLVEAGFDVYLPTVDDQAIDAIIRLPIGESVLKYHEVQIKGARTWSGIRCKTKALAANSILILYCAKDRHLLWLLYSDVQTHFPFVDEIHGPDWGNVFLNAEKVRELHNNGHGDISKLKLQISPPFK